MPTVKAPQPAPRSNLVISRRAEAHALGMLVEERRKELVKLWPGGRISAVEKHSFDDGAEGLGFEAHFSTQEFGPVIQAHRLRIDGGVATHVVATVIAAEHAELDSLLQVARSYRPPGEEPLDSVP